MSEDKEITKEQVEWIDNAITYGPNYGSILKFFQEVPFTSLDSYTINLELNQKIKEAMKPLLKQIDKYIKEMYPNIKLPFEDEGER